MTLEELEKENESFKKTNKKIADEYLAKRNKCIELQKENVVLKTEIENLKKDMEKILLENSDLKTILRGIHTNVGIALKDYNIQ